MMAAYRSLMKRLNSTGAKTEPWGTPFVSGNQSLVATQQQRYPQSTNLQLMGLPFGVQKVHHYDCCIALNRNIHENLKL